MKASVWISKETVTYVDKQRKRSLETIKPDANLSEIGAKDQFLVEWFELKNGKRVRCRKRIEFLGKDGFREARTLRTSIESDIASGKHQSKASKAITMQHLVQKYLEIEVPLMRAMSTKQDTERVLNRFIAACGKVQAIKFNKSHISEFKKYLGSLSGKEDYSNATINRHLRILKCCIRTLVDWEDLSKVPKITMLPEEPVNRPNITLDEFSLMLDNTNAATLPHGAIPTWLWWRAALAIYWETGIRRNELFGILWSKLVFNNEKQEGYFYLDASFTKTNEGRWCAFHSLSYGYLKQLGEHRREGQDVVFEWPHAVRQLNETLQRIQKRAGIDIDEKHKGFHSIRRSVGTITAVKDGPVMAQKKLGHKSLAVTMKHYAKAGVLQMLQDSKMPIPEKYKSGKNANL